MSSKRSPTPKPNSTDDGSTATSDVTKYQTFVSRVVHRSLLIGADYNPRTITSAARAKLKKLLRKHGLVASITWNARTGHVVGGHQRLSILDDLEGGHDYSLSVSAIDVDEAQERAINVALNNHTAGGDFDGAKLDELLRDMPDPNEFLDSIAMSSFELSAFGVMPLESLTLAGSPESVQAAISEATATNPPPAPKQPGVKARIEADLQRTRSSEYYVVAVFRTDAEKMAFNRGLIARGAAADPDERYLDGHFLAAQLGIDLADQSR